MSHRDAFLQAILAQPADPAPRLIYADWLEEQGDPQTELFRLQYALTRSADVENRAALEARQQQLLDAGVPPAAVTIINSIGMKLALIPPGEFWMGPPDEEELRKSNEHRHRVSIQKPFLLGVYVVTQSEYARVMGDNPSFYQRWVSPGLMVSDIADTDRCPVEQVAWYDAAEFCNRLSREEGLPAHYELRNLHWGDADLDRDHLIVHAKVSILGGNGYRLPSEAEWEYACRAGTTTPFHFGSQLNGGAANVNGEYPYGAAPGPNLRRIEMVGSYPPNAFGLYDMHGNVWEWCEDYCHRRSQPESPKNMDTGDSRVLRGGCWDRDAADARSASRYGHGPAYRDRVAGFRVARSL
jgi:uncharacterized protein (TIGR02996 family)